MRIGELAPELKQQAEPKAMIDSNQKLIYLASPYSGAEEDRFTAVCVIAAKLVSEGVFVFCPIAMAHPLKQAGDLPGGWEFWAAYDRRMIEACDELWVCDTMKGWDSSVGVAGEVAIAEHLGKPIVYLSKREKQQSVTA